MLSSQRTIDFQCPVCKHKHKIKLSLEEIEQAKFQLKLVQKAFGHEDFGQVIILHIDWELRVRRMTAYEFSKKNIGEENFTLDSNVLQINNDKNHKIDNKNARTLLDLKKGWKTKKTEENNLNIGQLIKGMLESSKKS